MLANDGVAGFTTRKVAEKASTSTPAVYELFGDKAGLVREMFIEGFRMLRRSFDRLDETDDPRADVVRIMAALRKFVRENPALAEVMFSRPFSDFDPGPAWREAGSAVRLSVVGRVRRCIDAGLLEGDATDVAHVLFSLTQGLAATEAAGWLGTSKASVDRRWEIGVRAVLDGLHYGRGRPAPARLEQAVPGGTPKAAPRGRPRGTPRRSR
jgi:AcrR family transcriptional regulator